MYKASVIISVYNNTEALRSVLDSLSMQTEKDFEIIVSEDAEHDEMKAFLASYPFVNDWQHLTQPDEGWRKNRALNRAILSAKSEWLIFVDGDCVLHPRFVEQHLALAGDCNIVAGKRVKLNDELSRLLIRNVHNYKAVERALLKCLVTGRSNGNKFIEEGFFIAPDSLLGFIPRIRKMHQIKGCNMSFSKTAIKKINGFDEDYVLPAIGEDIDLGWRFVHFGYRLVSARNLAIAYHLNHKENWTDQSANVKMMEEKRNRGEYACKNGLDNYV